MAERRLYQPDELVVAHNYTADGALADLLMGRDISEARSDLRAVTLSEHSDHFRRRVARVGGLGKTDPRHASRAQLLSAASHVPWNPATNVYKKRDVLPDNTNLCEGDDLEKLCQRLIRILGELQKILKHPPLAIVDYFDDSSAQGCFTTSMLRATLKAILGDAYKDFVYDKLRANFAATDVPLTNAEKYLERLDATMRNGFVGLFGGTFCNADDTHGLWMQEHVMRKRLFPNSYARGIFVCWSEQVLARALAKEFGIPLFIINGVLKFGTVPIEFLNEGGPFARMFSERKRRSTITCGATHSDHLVVVPASGEPWKKRWKLGDKIIARDRSQSLRVLAVDPLTGQPYGYSTGDGRFIGLAAHPEIDLTTTAGGDLETIREFVRRQLPATFLDRYHDIDQDTVGHNFDLSPAGKTDAPSIVRRDPGAPFFAATIEHLASSLLRDLRRR